MVHGLKLDVKTTPNLVYESCLAGKMHTDSFPPSTSCSSHLLKLVHTDVHHVTHLLFSCYCYWVTFINDYSRYCFMLPNKHKSDVFEVFKTFKVFTETQSEHKVKTLQDDKGGEYMSNAFTEFTIQCGILCWNTVQACP